MYATSVSKRMQARNSCLSADYTVYQTKDNLYASLGALENRFYSIFL